MGKTNRRPLGQGGFYRLCLEMDRQREDILTRRPLKKDLAEELSKKLQRPVTPNAIIRAANEIGLHWDSREGRPNKAWRRYGEQITALAVAVEVLYAHTGLEMPAEIKAALKNQPSSNDSE